MKIIFSHRIRQATKVANAVRRERAVRLGGNPWPELLSVEAPSGADYVAFRWEGGAVVRVFLSSEKGEYYVRWTVTRVTVQNCPLKEGGSRKGEKDVSFARLEKIQRGQFGWRSPALAEYPSMEEAA